MPLPQPFPGLVLHYAYLWHDQQRRGLEEGTKDRPCVIVSISDSPDHAPLVTVVPLTHKPPHGQAEHVEIPAVTKQRLGLDEDRSWIVVTEVNRFHWPGPDLRPVPGKVRGNYSYGVIPPKLFREVTDGILAAAAHQRLLSTNR